MLAITNEKARPQGQAQKRLDSLMVSRLFVFCLYHAQQLAGHALYTLSNTLHDLAETVGNTDWALEETP
jgi:hypothetical protein